MSLEKYISPGSAGQRNKNYHPRQVRFTPHTFLPSSTVPAIITVNSQQNEIRLRMSDSRRLRPRMISPNDEHEFSSCTGKFTNVLSCPLCASDCSWELAMSHDGITDLPRPIANQTSVICGPFAIHRTTIVNLCTIRTAVLPVKFSPFTKVRRQVNTWKPQAGRSR